MLNVGASGDVVLTTAVPLYTEEASLLPTEIVQERDCLTVLLLEVAADDVEKERPDLVFDRRQLKVDA